jgi:uncharacterized protein YraI
MSDPAVSAAERGAGVNDDECPECGEWCDGRTCDECGWDLQDEKDDAAYDAFEAARDDMM